MSPWICDLLVFLYANAVSKSSTSFAYDTYSLAEPGCRYPFSSSLVAQDKTYWRVQTIRFLQNGLTLFTSQIPKPTTCVWCFTALLRRQWHESWFTYGILWHKSASDVTTREVLICPVFDAKFSTACEQILPTLGATKEPPLRHHWLRSFANCTRATYRVHPYLLWRFAS